MKTDSDLLFLQHCDNNDLCTLCDILTHDNHGKIRLTEQLTKLDSFNLSYPDNMKGMWQDLAAELQRYGGNTILNLYRHGRGPSYESIVEDVCRMMKVPNIGEHDTAQEMEEKLLVFVSSNMLGKMTKEDLAQMMEELNIRDFDLTKQEITASLLLLMRIGRKQFLQVLNYVLRTISRRLLGRSVVQVGSQIGSRSLGTVLGPVAWMALSVWTIWDIMGPAYRVCVPAIMQVAYMRYKYSETSNSYAHAS